METGKEKNKDTTAKTGVVPEDQLQGSDADLAYNEDAEFEKTAENIKGKDNTSDKNESTSNKQKGADADTDQSSVS
ncbi:hypothetical protein [Pedobacter metabolipauper]|uniref:Uncharacterized protein n=1 Tax=Pedobacter metabolipauper TaxID=425513 RepID=A0A4R6T0S7_9SPHI|nr:hypothetical protein [Pedobacter metabolipauper]TDQ11188.1 hypothetical protein ATK78_0304 [Pedobacter metabolipauper]